MSQKVRVGLIGAGSICRGRHLPGLAKIPDVELVAVCNRSEASGRAIATDFDIAHVDDDWRKLVRRDDVDAVFIGTWPYMHRQLSVATLQAGKHCFCQARMAMDLADAKQMVAAVAAHPHPVNMISPCPFPMEHQMRRMVHGGQLGLITSVELISVNGGNLDRSAVTWRERREYSGNQVMAMGIMAEMLNALVGPYEHLSAVTATPIATKVDESGSSVPIAIPQVVTITGRLANGALAVEHHSGLAADSTSGRSCLTIRGLGGTLRYNFDQKLEFARVGEPLAQVDVPEDARTGWTVEQDFIAAVREAREGKSAQARPVRPDFAEGLLYMRKVEAVHVSAATGRAVYPARL